MRPAAKSLLSLLQYFSRSWDCFTPLPSRCSIMVLNRRERSSGIAVPNFLRPATKFDIVTLKEFLVSGIGALSYSASHTVSFDGNITEYANPGPNFHRSF